MTENVISISSRKPLVQQMAEDAERAEEERRDQAERDQMFIDLQLKVLDDVRLQIKNGTLSDLIVISRSPETGMFMQDMILNPSTAKSSVVFGLVGILECMKLELTEVASMAPTIMSDGAIIDAHAEGVGDDYPEGEEW